MPASSSIVCITEGIPVNDMVKVKAFARRLRQPADRPELPRHHHPGRVQDRHHAGLHSQAGQDRHRVALRHADRTKPCVPDHQRQRPRPEHLRRHRRRPGARHELHRRARRCFEEDPKTEGIIMVGEIGGADEEAAAEFIRRECHQAGRVLHRRRHRASGKRMGHAGAIVSGGKGTAADKFAALERAGVRTVKSLGRSGQGHHRAALPRAGGKKAKVVSLPG